MFIKPRITAKKLFDPGDLNSNSPSPSKKPRSFKIISREKMATMRKKSEEKRKTETGFSLGFEKTESILLCESNLSASSATWRKNLASFLTSKIYYIISIMHLITFAVVLIGEHVSDDIIRHQIIMTSQRPKSDYGIKVFYLVEILLLMQLFFDMAVHLMAF